MSSIPTSANGARRRKILARLKAEERPCHICGLGIDSHATGALKFNCDEIIPRAHGGSPYDYNNVASAHACCNNWRSIKSLEYVSVIRAQVLATFGVWTNPLEFVSNAKTIEKNQKNKKINKKPYATTKW